MNARSLLFVVAFHICWISYLIWIHNRPHQKYIEGDVCYPEVRLKIDTKLGD